MEDLDPSANPDRTAVSASPDSANAPVVWRSRRMLLFLLLPALLCLVVAAIFFKMLMKERIPELSVAELERAEALWNGAGPTSYNMDLEILGARPGTVHVEVRNEEVIAMQRDGRTPPPHTWRYWSVPGLFETLERELTMSEDPIHEVGTSAGTIWQVRCEFDPAYGFPRRFHRYVSAGGPEVYWRVTTFMPR
jgi:hypothetical protein